jgi:hypothetical protein
MIRLPTLRLAGCVVCAGLILSNDSPPFEARLPPAKTEPTAPEIPSSADDANSPLRDVRLTGVVIAPGLRIAIFAVSGTNSLVLSEGETLKDWRLDRILPGEVLLSSQAGTIKLEPKLDANLVRPTPPVAVRSDKLEPSAELAGAPGEPTATTPIPAGNFSAAMPVQTQFYTYYFPENYAGYGQNYPSYDYYPYLYPSFAYVAPIGSAFRFDFFHRHDIHHDGFRGAAMPFHGDAIPFHGVAIPFHGAAFHGGGHR